MSTRSMRRSRPVSEPEPLDPEIARAQAAAAASRAMRSSERSSTESKNSYDRLGGPASVAIPRRRPNSSLQCTTDSASLGAASNPPVTPRQSVDMAGSTRAPSLEQPAVLPPITELNGMDGRDSSVPSSYRRLRKAKSMFSTRQRLSHAPFVLSPSSPRNLCDPDRSPEFELPRTLRHSISFMRGGNRRDSHANRCSIGQETAIQLARSQFLEETGEMGSQARRSSFFSSRRKREHRPFRKTFRIASDSGLGTSPSSGDPNLRRSHSRSRTFSASLKNGIKRVFGLSKSSGPSHESQNAPEPPFVTEEGTVDSPRTSNINSDVTVINHPTEPSPLRDTRAPPSHDSPCTSDSRVTSWADSTVANTATTRRTGHRQSLSLIEEQEDLNQQLPQVAGIDADSQSPSRRRLATRKLEGWVNTHDLYSALMQQIGRNSAHSDDEGIVFGSVPEHRVVPERTSSIHSHRSRRTIRHVPSVESSASPRSFATARGESLTPQKHHSRSIRHIPRATTSRFPPGQENSRPSGVYTAVKPPRSAFVIGEESDEETGSVIVARFGDSETKTVSPSSVYSRTISGETLTSYVETDRVGTMAAEEPGTATIYASQRTAYTSPSRADGSVTSKTQVQPSADWQQWMNSQIERIEKASPAREHVREGAQFNDDNDEIFMGMVRRAPFPESRPTGVSYVPDNPACSDTEPSTLPKALAPNNFSRPFSRSSSVQIVLSSQKVKHSDDVVNDASADGAPDAAPMPRRNSREGALSPMRVRNANLLQVPESPTPQRTGSELHKRMWTQEQYRRQSVRRPLVNGKPNQFRSMRSHRDFRALNNENTRQQDDEDLMDEYNRPAGIHATMSSKHMVEMFLDSRRRRMGTEMPGPTADGAFL
ncbi:uncharacterized protein N7459_007962 [Penicillium hispanicum]|uniref:uncharacterized protein n=1 Tax=Penicillium hispanicum TaxID=1080232 RepID=UPI002540D26D|nr:uncharacterized protein N7459_007962 [Penicillium hispanicum]KAJ5573535.1 hypothetical protein N7459_007962 [Penicillium hispanicum]